jgi:hypothetical protein
MGKGFPLSLAAFQALFLSAGALQTQLPSDSLPVPEYGAALLRAAAARLLPALLGHKLERMWAVFPFSPQTQSSDGGGGSSDGSGGSGDGNGGPGAGGSSTDGGTTASTDGSAASSSESDDSTATAVDALANALTAVTTDPTAVTTVDNVDQAVSPLDVIQSEATTDPRAARSLKASLMLAAQPVLASLVRRGRPGRRLRPRMS